MATKDYINKLINGDCFDIFKNIDDKSIDLILTDIPYGEVNMKSQGLRTLDRGKADELQFDLKNFLENCLRISNGSIYIFCGIEQVSEIRKFFRLSGLSTRSCVYEKTNPSPMNGQYMWLSGIEHCVYAKHKNATFNEKCKNSVWKYPVGRNKVHPTEKNYKLFEYLIGVSSNEGDIVFDPCMGSGTTCLAAKNTNRNYIGVEKDTENGYFEYAVSRLNS